MWYKKRQLAGYFAESMKVDNLFNRINNYVHGDDMKEVQKVLELTDEGMEVLFEEHGECL